MTRLKGSDLFIITYALEGHGKYAGASDAKSKFTVFDDVVKNLLQRRDVVSSKVYNGVDSDGVTIVENKFIYQVDIGEVIGITRVQGTVENTSIITVITNRSGDIINVFPGEI